MSDHSNFIWNDSETIFLKGRFKHTVKKGLCKYSKKGQILNTSLFSIPFSKKMTCSNSQVHSHVYTQNNITMHILIYCKHDNQTHASKTFRQLKKKLQAAKAKTNFLYRPLSIYFLYHDNPIFRSM